MDYAESEWEDLQCLREFTDIDNTNINMPIQRISIKRDDSYNIIMDITVNDITSHEESKLKKLNNLLFKHDYMLINISCNYRQTERFFDYYDGKYIFTYSVEKLEHKRTSYSENSRKEWFLNSVKYRSNKRLFCQKTRYNIDKTKQRLGNLEVDSLETNTQIVYDYVTITCPGTNFGKITLQSVQDVFCPEWSSCLCVEYHNPPTQSECDKVHSILNFILGRYLIKVGTTGLDIHDNIIYETSVAPEEGFDVKGFCDMPEKSIILPLIVKTSNPDNIQKTLSHIINTYLAIKEDLTNPLHLYGQSLISNPNIEIILIGAAIESFAEVMGFKGTSKVKIYSFIYESGLAVKDGHMISIGSIEDDVRDYRNQVTHGKFIGDNQTLYTYNLVYRILFSRILLTYLKIGKYYDLTTGMIKSMTESIDAKEFKRVQRVLRKNKYNNSRKYYIELFKEIRKK